MIFADLKNDFIFRRIFATHPDILRGLLNDLLDRTGDEAIVDIEYLPSEQLPLVLGAKLSILDVRCRDRAGTTFVVEMQLIHVPGFHAPELTEVPTDLPGPQRRALELANKTTFSQEELNAYQKVIDEIQQVRELAEAKWVEGKAVGVAEGKRDTLLRLLTRAGLPLTEEDRARIQACTDPAILDQWIDNVFGAKPPPTS